MNSLLIGKRVFFIPCLLLFFLLEAGCSKEPKRESFLVGTWRVQVKKTHTILTFAGNGSWNANTRIEGKHSKIIEKRGKVRGKWEYVETRLTLRPTEVDQDIGWDKGGVYRYDVVRLTKEEMVWEDSETGRRRVWLRVRGKAQAESGALDVGEQEVGLDPLVVNLDKEREYRKGRFMCLKVDFLVDVSEEDLDEGEMYRIHPRVKDAMVMYLSSLVYREVKKYEKIEELRRELIVILDPYFAGKLRDIKIRHIVVTASSQSVDEFLQEYAGSRPAGEGEMAGS